MRSRLLLFVVVSDSLVRYLPFLLIAAVFAACKPDPLAGYREYSKEDDAVYQIYLTGDVAAARSALLEEEKIVAKYEAKGAIDGRACRLVLYGRLCAVTAHMGLTNEALACFDKYLASKENTNGITMADVIAAIERSDQEKPPRWRQQK